jgi:hypothetical protein
MRDLADGLVLYHGSYTIVENPLLEKCAPHKDFGRGFYLTSSHSQALNFAKTSTRKALGSRVVGDDSGVCGYVSRFVFAEPAEPLAVHLFHDADAAWLHCIVAHRKVGALSDVLRAMASYDVVAGKIANDQTNATLTAYISGLYGLVGSAAAETTCLSLLLPERLQDQFCFRTERALSCLTFEGSEQVCL